MKSLSAPCFLLTFGLLCISCVQAQTVSVSFPATRSEKPLDGRLLFLVSNDPKAPTDPKAEPRLQINDSARTQMVFGVTVDGWRPGQPLTIGDEAAGYPRAHLKDIPPGDYTVQAVLNVYETFHRADGKTVKLAPDRGEGKQWNLAPGNLLSKPTRARFGPGAPAITLSLDQVIPPLKPPADTEFVR